MVQLAADPFDRADNADLGTNWTPGPDGFQIVSNAVRPANDSIDSWESFNAITWPDNQYSASTLAGVINNGLGEGCGVICRADTGGAETFYRLVGSGAGWELMRSVSGVTVSLGSSATPVFTNGDEIRLNVITVGANCAWSCKQNGVEFASGTDTTPIASGRAGIFYSSPDVGASG